MTNEIVLMWAAVTSYVISTALFVLAISFERTGLMRAGVWAAGIGVALHGVALGIRWERVGHGPMRGYYEMTSSMCFLAVLLYLGLVWRYRKTAPVGIVVMPVALLLVATAMMAPKGGLDITSTLASYWLYIHVIFAKLGAGTLVISFGLAVVYLIRSRAITGPWSRSLDRLPSQEIVEHLSARFVFAGFIFWGMMIASGAIWANEAWGRYWSWDPIETWSLVAWLVYAVYLHLRQTLGWHGDKLAWVAIGALPFILFCLLGIPLVYNTVHSGYLAW